MLINGYAAPGVNGRFYPGRGACRVLPAGAELAESAERPRVDLGALPPTRVA